MDNYNADDSWSNTEYLEFLGQDSPYPAVSLCLREPFIQAEMERHNITNHQARTLLRTGALEKNT